MKRWKARCAPLAFVAAIACADAGGGGLLSPDGANPRLTITTVSVTCPDTISVGQTAQCIHYAYDQNNSLVSGSTATWGTTTPSLISVSSTGSITGLAVGNAVVQATSGGVTGSHNVYVKPGLSITINGPGSVQRYATCTWWAGVSNGTWPYSYSWQAVSGGSGTASYDQWTGFTISSVGFTLKVTVTDANGIKATQSRFITTDTSAPSC